MLKVFISLIVAREGWAGQGCATLLPSRPRGVADACTGNTYEGFTDGHDGLRAIIFEFLEWGEVVATEVEFLGRVIEQYGGKAGIKKLK